MSHPPVTPKWFTRKSRHKETRKRKRIDTMRRIIGVRRILIGVPAAVVLAVIAAFAAATTLHPARQVAAAAPAKPPAAVREYVHTVRAVPVLAWHQMNHGCAPSAAVCN